MSKAAAVRPDLARRRAEQKQAILQAAILEFAENGFHGASTQAIADRAGITKTRLHYYITSKEDLYLEALEQILALWRDLFHGFDMSAGPEAFLREYIRRKVVHAIEHPEVVRLFTGEIMRGAPMLRDLWEPSRGDVLRAAEAIEGWIASGAIRPVDPILLQLNIWAMTEHYALHEAELRFMTGQEAGAPLDAERIAAEIADLVLRGLRP